MFGRDASNCLLDVRRQLQLHHMLGLGLMNNWFIVSTRLSPGLSYETLKRELDYSLVRFLFQMGPNANSSGFEKREREEL